MQYAGCIILFAEVLILFICAVFQLSYLPNNILELHPSAGQKYGSQRVLNQGSRQDEGEQSIPLSEMPL
jgi:hypothetical protein